MASLIKRGNTFHIQWYEGGTQRRRSLRTDSLQIAKEKLRQFESARLRGEDSPLPTRTPIGEVVAAYIEHIKAHKTENSWRKDLSYLRELFGPVCPALEVPDGRAAKCRDHRSKRDRRVKLRPMEAECFEAITTAMITDFIATRVRERGYAPKTANRYREVVGRVFSLALKEGRIRTAGGANPATRVERYRERAPEIRYLTLAQIDEQLDALRFNPRLQVMVATLIYAGLRREELLWLQVDDWARSTPAAPGGLLRIRAKTVAGESWQPKTKRNRVVPVSSKLREHLERYVVPASDHGWLFPSPKGTRWNGDNFAADLRSANGVAGLSWSCLDYRHTFGSQLAQRGLSLYQIATLMGNSPEICRQHYAAIAPEAMADLIDFGVSGDIDRRAVRAAE